jgi:hypothetical protein
MTNINKFSFLKDSKVGISILVEDDELADSFDDFLTEEMYVLYNLRERDGKQEFLFGNAASEIKLSRIIDAFLEGRNNVD